MGRSGPQEQIDHHKNGMYYEPACLLDPHYANLSLALYFFNYMPQYL